MLFVSSWLCAANLNTSIHSRAIVSYKFWKVGLQPCIRQHYVTKLFLWFHVDQQRTLLELDNVDKLLEHVQRQTLMTVWSDNLGKVNSLSVNCNIRPSYYLLVVAVQVLKNTFLTTIWHSNYYWLSDDTSLIWSQRSCLAHSQKLLLQCLHIWV
jgi:hypothetical protein